MSNIRFASPEHRDFFLDMMSEARQNDCYPVSYTHLDVYKRQFERMEVFMEGLFFAIGFLLGGVVGVLIMCLLQINRIGKKEDSEE